MTIICTWWGHELLRLEHDYHRYPPEMATVTFFFIFCINLLPFPSPPNWDEISHLANQYNTTKVTFETSEIRS
jgi:hypothetical protein